MKTLAFMFMLNLVALFVLLGLGVLVLASGVPGWLCDVVECVIGFVLVFCVAHFAKKRW